ncbi:MAG: hypothetical protein RLZZ484_59 [Pseudomonadota bacterium]
MTALAQNNGAARYDQWIQYPPRPVNPAMPSTLNSPDKQVNWVRFPPIPNSPAQPPVVVDKAQEVSAPPAAPQEEARKASLPVDLAPSDSAPSQPLVTPEKAQVAVVKGFDLQGTSALTLKELTQVLQPTLGQPLEMPILEKIVSLLDQHYDSKGKLGRAEIPAQDLTDGIVQVVVREGRFAGAVVEPATQTRVPPALAVDLVETAQPKGAVVNLQALDRASLLLAELPGVQAQMSLRPAAKEGETEAVIQINEAPGTEGSLTFDNSVVSATGSTRSIAQLSHHGGLGRADTLSLVWMQTQGSEYLKLGYSEPLGGAGKRVGMNVSSSKYQLILPQYMALNPTGPANSIGLDLSVPWLRSRSANSTLQFGYEHKSFVNNTAAGLVSDYRINTLSATLQGQQSDDWLGGGEFATSVQVVRGNVDLNGSPNQSMDAMTTQTAGPYAKLRLMASRVQRLGSQQTLVATWQMQSASKNLDGSEKFFLGGSQGVRAYPTNEGGGSQGRSLNLEWQHLLRPMGQPVTLSAFYDVATIDVNKFNDFVGGASLNSYTLQGTGLWVGSAFAHGWGKPLQWRLSLSRRLGANPMATSSGLDQDGSYRLNRMWFSFNQPF